MATPIPQLTPQAQQGLDYLRTRYPETADAVMKQFSPATPVNAATLSTPSMVSVPPAPVTPVPDYTKVAVSTPSVPTTITNTAKQDALDAERDSIVSDITATSDKMATKGARKAELETQQNIPGLNTQLNEINNLIRGEQSAVARFAGS